LAEGGFGRVLRVVDQRDGRALAIKAPRFDDEASRRRFRREVEVQASLDHPNVMPVLDWGENWMAMPLASASLADRAPDMFHNEVLMAFEHAVLGLQAAHRKGLVHRDVKPHNILLLDRNGDRRWVVADFGLVRRPPGETTSVRTVGFVGTEGFAAPEARADAHTAGAAADVYSLGRSLLWVLSGRADGAPPEPWQRLINPMVAEAITVRPSLEEVAAGLKEIRTLLAAARRAAWGRSEADLSNEEVEVLAAVLESLFTPEDERQTYANLKGIVRSCPTLLPAGVRIQLKSLERRAFIREAWNDCWAVTDEGWAWLQANQHKMPIKRPPPEDIPF